MNKELTAIICSLLRFLFVAVPAKRLQIVGVICPAEFHGDNVIQRQRPFLATSRTSSIRRISVQDGLPLRWRTIAVGVLLASTIAGACYAVVFPMGFRVSFPIGAANGVASLFVIPSPIGRQLIQAFAVVLTVLALLFTDSVGVILTVTLITFAFLVGVSSGVIALIGGAASTAFRLLAVGVTLIGRKAIGRFGLFALSASLEDNRHYSISLLDWIVPRLYQQRVVFSYPDYTTFSPTVPNGIGGQA